MQKLEAKISDFNFAIFDINGTLLDNRRPYRWLLRAISTLTIWKDSGELFLPTGGIAIPCWAETLRYSVGLAWVTLRIEKVLAIFFEIVDAPNPKLFGGTKEVLWQLYNNGIKLFATTGDKTLTIEGQLKKLGINDLFLGICGRELPKREHIPYFAKLVNLPLKEFARRSFLVSDGPVDLTLAQKYGLYSIGITNTLTTELLLAAGAKEIITDLGELAPKI